MRVRRMRVKANLAHSVVFYRRNYNLWIPDTRALVNISCLPALLLAIQRRVEAVFLFVAAVNIMAVLDVLVIVAVYARFF